MKAISIARIKRRAASRERHVREAAAGGTPKKEKPQLTSSQQKARAKRKPPGHHKAYRKAWRRKVIAVKTAIIRQICPVRVTGSNKKKYPAWRWKGARSHLKVVK